MNRTKILLVKRDRREIEQLKSVIEEDNQYELVDICENGSKAIASIVENVPDIVITDEVLPEKDVLEVMEETLKHKTLKNVRFMISVVLQ